MKTLSRRLGVDGWLAATFLICAVLAFVGTLGFPASAGIWPRWVIGIFGGLSALLVVVKLATEGEV